jgi:enoyl-CoA hydratase
VPAAELDREVDALAHRMASVPKNQLMMQKLIINQALTNMGLHTTQVIATVFDGITRHSPEGLNFKRRAEEVGWKRAVRERDEGTFDWTTFAPLKANGGARQRARPRKSAAGTLGGPDSRRRNVKTRGGASTS